MYVCVYTNSPSQGEALLRYPYEIMFLYSSAGLIYYSTFDRMPVKNIFTASNASKLQILSLIICSKTPLSIFTKLHLIASLMLHILMWSAQQTPNFHNLESSSLAVWFPLRIWALILLCSFRLPQSACMLPEFYTKASQTFKPMPEVAAPLLDLNCRDVYMSMEWG